MSSNYQAYIDHLASFADSHSLAIETERNIYPLFKDIKKLINHYKSTITKFGTVQLELINFIERLEFDDNDFDYYQTKFIELRKVDESLQELKSKNVSASITNEIQNFIANTYSSTSLYNVHEIEEKVLSYHNKAAETQRHEAQKASTVKFFIVFAVVVVLIIYLFSKC